MKVMSLRYLHGERHETECRSEKYGEMNIPAEKGHNWGRGAAVDGPQRVVVVVPAVLLCNPVVVCVFLIAHSVPRVLQSVKKHYKRQHEIGQCNWPENAAALQRCQYLHHAAVVVQTLHGYGQLDRKSVV